MIVKQNINSPDQLMHVYLQLYPKICILYHETLNKSSHQNKPGFQAHSVLYQVDIWGSFFSGKAVGA